MEKGLEPGSGSCWLSESNELDLSIQKNCRPNSVYHYRSIALASSIHVKGVVLWHRFECLPSIMRGRFALGLAIAPPFVPLTFLALAHILCWKYARDVHACRSPADAAHHGMPVISRPGLPVVGGSLVLARRDWWINC